MKWRTFQNSNRRWLLIIVLIAMVSGCGMLSIESKSQGLSSTSPSIIMTTVSFFSHLFRDVGSPQISQSTELTTYAGTGSTPSLPATFHEVPNILTDDNGSNTLDFNPNCATDGSICTTIVSITGAQHAAFVDCGTTQTSVAARVADCSTKNGAVASWNGQVKATGGQGIWNLVTRMGANEEVWQDQQTGFLWSSRVTHLFSASSGDNWCRASGNVQAADPSNFCNSTTYQPQFPVAESDCAEGTNLVATNGWCSQQGFVTSAACTAGGNTWVANTENYAAGIYSAAKGGMGANSATLKVRWRLPAVGDFSQADAHGFRFVMPDGGGLGWALYGEWTATIGGGNGDVTQRNSAYGYDPVSGDISGGQDRSSHVYHVRCVGR